MSPSTASFRPASPSASPLSGRRAVRPPAAILMSVAFLLAPQPGPGPSFFGPAALTGQSAGELGVGSRVRVDAPRYGLDARVALVREVRDRGLVLDLDGERLRVEADAMERLDVSVGRGDRRRLGWMIGAGAGAAVGALTGFASGDDPPCDPPRLSGSGGGGGFSGLGHALAAAFAQAAYEACESARSTGGEKAKTRAVLYGLTGSVIGVLIGRSIDVERWTEIDVGATTFSVQPSVQPSGVDLSVTLPTGSP